MGDIFNSQDVNVFTREYSPIPMDGSVCMIGNDANKLHGFFFVDGSTVDPQIHGIHGIRILWDRSKEFWPQKTSANSASKRHFRMRSRASLLSFGPASKHAGLRQEIHWDLVRFGNGKP